jgi:hypothetical protein
MNNNVLMGQEDCRGKYLKPFGSNTVEYSKSLRDIEAMPRGIILIFNNTH